MDAKHEFVECLLDFERRIYRVYEKWAANEAFPDDLRAFWSEMATEEKQHLAILERSAGLLNFAALPPRLSDTPIEKIAATIAMAERASEKLELTADEALGHALALESSELNHLDDAWLREFHPDLGKLTRTSLPVFKEHIRRLSDAIRRFTVNENLHKQAAALLSESK